MAYLEQRRGTWRAQVRMVGFPQLSKSFSTKKDAEKWAKDIEALQRGSGKFGRPYRQAGIYLLIDCGEIVYVGRSSHILRRLNDHARNGKKWDSYHVIPCPNSIKAAILENEYIEKYRPRYNRTH